MAVREREEREITLNVSNALMARMAISIITSNETRGWKWVKQTLQKRFMFRGDYSLKSLEAERAFLFTEDPIARQQLSASATVFEEGVKIRINP